MGFVARYIGGVYVNRNHKGDPNARPPLVLVEPKKQREALEFLEQQVLRSRRLPVPRQALRFPRRVALEALGNEKHGAAGLRGA